MSAISSEGRGETALAGSPPNQTSATPSGRHRSVYKTYKRNKRRYTVRDRYGSFSAGQKRWRRWGDPRQIKQTQCRLVDIDQYIRPTKRVRHDVPRAAAKAIFLSGDGGATLEESSSHRTNTRPSGRYRLVYKICERNRSWRTVHDHYHHFSAGRGGGGFEEIFVKSSKHSVVW